MRHVYVDSFYRPPSQQCDSRKKLLETCFHSRTERVKAERQSFPAGAIFTAGELNESHNCLWDHHGCMRRGTYYIAWYGRITVGRVIGDLELMLVGKKHASDE
ncbi:hypothetical protein CEXT_149311 [Caerostris extrusa]|uniref:Uncharacterized protein n=1 Tax=Caerostris extrusa TaxID=172846 RepID=A0AAV4Y1V1_CAEEX|nr:hypothetical protein CEXT_149311 [Caerostris extrusa]